MDIFEKKGSVAGISESHDGCYYNDYRHGRSGYGYDGYGCNSYRNVNGKANAGMTLGIIGSVLGGAALLKNGWRGGLFGNGGNGTLDGANININGAMPSGYSNGPTAFQSWEKGCEDTLALQKGLYEWALTQQGQRFADRQTIDSELFGLYKSQVDADFSLYKGYRDSFDGLLATSNLNDFNLYKKTRDDFDSLSKRISDLETKEAVNAAVEPWRAKVLDMRINEVANGAMSGIALEAERRCCADNKIVNYLNSNFYPINVADVTVGTTSTTRTTSNPLCGCCNGGCNRQ